MQPNSPQSIKQNTYRPSHPLTIYPSIHSYTTTPPLLPPQKNPNPNLNLPIYTQTQNSNFYSCTITSEQITRLSSQQ